MADVRPFPGVRFDAARVSLTRALCPPYDVISPEEGARLRRDDASAIHLELPEGEGEEKYQKAAGLWRRWRREGMLADDTTPCLYVVEERFPAKSKTLKRVGFLAAVGVAGEAASALVPHERTLPKAKEDRLKLLEAVRANVSPIFGVFADRSGAVRAALDAARRARPDAAGRLAEVEYRLWALSDPALVAAVTQAISPTPILIADGHHRLEVSKEFHRLHPALETETVLAYLCPEEDPGLVVLPTHRVVAGGGLLAAARKLCNLTPAATEALLLRRLARAENPYAFGLAEGGTLALAEPLEDLGCRSGMSVEWTGKNLLAAVDPQAIRYTPDGPKALAWGKESRSSVVLIKPFPVSRVREAVSAVGLLPPKSTYFYPKIATGLVFKAL